MSPNVYMKLLFIPRHKSFLKDTSVSLGLLFISRPSAIRPAVVPIIINSVDSSLFFSKFFNVLEVTSVHIFPEFFKGTPKVFYASSAISAIFMTFRILTSSFKGHVNVVKSLIGESMRKVEKSYSCPTTFASARLSTSASKVRTWDYLFVSATTNTLKNRILMFIGSLVRQNSKKTKLTTCQVYPLHLLQLAE